MKKLIGVLLIVGLSGCCNDPSHEVNIPPKTGHEKFVEMREIKLKYYDSMFNHCQFNSEKYHYYSNKWSWYQGACHAYIN